MRHDFHVKGSCLNQTRGPSHLLNFLKASPVGTCAGETILFLLSIFRLTYVIQSMYWVCGYLLTMSGPDISLLDLKIHQCKIYCLGDKIQHILKWRQLNCHVGRKICGVMLICRKRCCFMTSQGTWSLTEIIFLGVPGYLINCRSWVPGKTEPDHTAGCQGMWLYIPFLCLRGKKLHREMVKLDKKNGFLLLYLLILKCMYPKFDCTETNK